MNQTQPPKKFGFGISAGDPKKLLILVGIIFLLVLGSFVVFGGGGGNTQQTVDLVARAREIARVSDVQTLQLQFKNTSVSDLATTTLISLKSQQADFTSYLKKAHVKVGTKQLLARTNKSTDLQLQTASVNNDLDSAYLAYLKSALKSYQAALSSTYKMTKSKTLKEYLVSANNSVNALLQSPLLVSA